MICAIEDGFGSQEVTGLIRRLGNLNQIAYFFISVFFFSDLAFVFLPVEANCWYFWHEF